MKKIIVIIAAVIALSMAYFYVRHPLGQKVIINGHTFNVEVAVTDSEKQKGLGERDSLASDSGMLFVYTTRNRYGFWMKGMRFPLDFIWIDGNTVMDISTNIPAPPTPDAPPVELSPKVPVDKILEVNAGIIQSLNIHIGDTVHFSD